ncbi:Uncharacterized protein FWK35_00008186, partial [Aphis craccivora]
VELSRARRYTIAANCENPRHRRRRRLLLLLLPDFRCSVSKPREVPARNNRSNCTGRPVPLQRNQWVTHHNNRWNIDHYSKLFATRYFIVVCGGHCLARVKTHRATRM